MLSYSSNRHQVAAEVQLFRFQPEVAECLTCVRANNCEAVLCWWPLRVDSGRQVSVSSGPPVWSQTSARQPAAAVAPQRWHHVRKSGVKWIIKAPREGSRVYFWNNKVMVPCKNILARKCICPIYSVKNLFFKIFLWSKSSIHERKKGRSESKEWREKEFN